MILAGSNRGTCSRLKATRRVAAARAANVTWEVMVTGLPVEESESVWERKWRKKVLTSS